MSFKDSSSFWQYTVYADIRRGSLERTRHGTYCCRMRLGIAEFYSLCHTVWVMNQPDHRTYASDVTAVGLANYGDRE